MSDWSEKQKKAFIKIQDVFAELGLTNQEVADMFTTFTNRDDVATLFAFQTGRWARLLKMVED